jgi:hypothetical protein
MFQGQLKVDYLIIITMQMIVQFGRFVKISRFIVNTTRICAIKTVIKRSMCSQRVLFSLIRHFFSLIKGMDQQK